MPDFKNIEILDGKEGVPSAKGRTIKSTPTPARQDAEVVGHHHAVRVMRCYSCGALTYVDFDPDSLLEYRCGNCNASNTLD